jgi:menaquinone-dependent protoporphyrinogen oxidase
MRILILYGTVEGQTRKIAGHIGNTLEKAGHDVLLIDATGEGDLPEPARFDAIIVSAPVHAGMFPHPLRRMIKKNAEKLMARPGAFISVSLAAVSDDNGEIDEIAEYVNRMSAETGWWPVMMHHAAGALKYLEYDFFRRWIMKRIVAKEGGPTDTTRDYEFTDWDALDDFVSGFVKDVPELAGKL